MPHTNTKSDDESQVTEGGKAPSPTMAKGHPMPAASRAQADGTTEDGTSHATAGKAEKQAAGLNKDQNGRGHRKAG